MSSQKINRSRRVEPVRMPRAAATAAVVAAACLAVPRLSPAATLIWDPLMTGTGSDGSGTWTDGSAGGPANWSTGTGDTVFLSSDPDSAVFGVGGTGAYNVTLGSPITVQDVTFNSGSYTIAGSGSNTLTLSQNSNITTNVNATIGAVIVDNTNINSANYGPSGLTKNGSGTLTLSGANSYTGPTQVNAGTLIISNREVFDANGNALAESAVTVAQGATVDLRYTNYADYTNEPIVINGDGTTTGHGLLLGGGVEFHTNEGLTLQTAPTVINTDGTGTGPAYLAGFDVNSGDFLTVASTASGSSSTANVDIDTEYYGYNLHVDPGAATATGDFTFNGAIVSLVAGYGGNYDTINGTTDVYNGFTKTGAGSLVLTGQSTFTGSITVASGSVILQGGDNRLPTSTVVVVGDSSGDAGSLVLNGVNQTVTGLFLAGGANASSGIVGGSTTASTLTVNLLATNSIITAPYNSSNNSHTPLTNAADTYAGMLGGTGTNQNNLALVKTGPGTLILSGTSTYTGTTNVSAGTLVLASTGAAASVSPTTVMAGALLDVQASNGGGYAGAPIVINGDGTGTGHGLLLAPGVTFNTDAGVTLQSAPTVIDTDGTTGDGSGIATISGFDVNQPFFLHVAATASGSSSTANINFGTGPYGYDLLVDAGSATATGDFTLNGAITGTGNATAGVSGGFDAALNKLGTGSLVLTGQSTYSAGTSVANGSVILSGGSNRLPTATIVQLGVGTTSGQLVLNGVSQAIAGLQTGGTGTANAVVGGSTTASTLTVSYASGTDAYAGTIGGTGTNANNVGLTVAGAGTLVLSGSNTYTGPTAVTTGTLAVTGSTAAGSAVTISSGAVLAGTGTVAGTVSVSGTITGGSGATTADSVGTLTTGKQSWTSSGTDLAKVTSISSSGTSADELVLSGLTVSSRFTVALQNTSGASPAFTAADAKLTSTPTAGSYVVLVRDTESSATNPFATPATLAALGLVLTDSGVTPHASTDVIELAQEADGTGFDLIAEDVATPEPTSLALLVAAAAPALIGRRRRSGSTRTA